MSENELFGRTVYRGPKHFRDARKKLLAGLSKTRRRAHLEAAGIRSRGDTKTDTRKPHLDEIDRDNG